MVIYFTVTNTYQSLVKQFLQVMLGRFDCVESKSLEFALTYVLGFPSKFLLEKKSIKMGHCFLAPNFIKSLIQLMVSAARLIKIRIIFHS